MAEPRRLVVDTNVLVSRLLLPNSVPGRVVRAAVERARLLVSDATMKELADVLARPKFDPYVTIDERQGFVLRLGRIVELVAVRRPVTYCRDPKDDRLLEVAVNGRADMIVTGDRDLLTLNDFEGVPIIAPAAYLDLLGT